MSWYDFDNLVLVNTLTRDTIAAGVLGPSTPLTDSSLLARAAPRFVVRHGWIPRTVRERPMRAAFGDEVLEPWAEYVGDQRWGDRRSLLAWIKHG